MNNEDDLDRLLRDNLLEPPEGFGARVMRRIRQTNVPAIEGRSAVAGWRANPMLARARIGLKWLALSAAGLVGAIQLAGFLLGVWAVSAAG